MPRGSFTWIAPAADRAGPAGTSVRVDAVGRKAPSPCATGAHTPLRRSGAKSSPSPWACCQGWTGRTM